MSEDKKNKQFEDELEDAWQKACSGGVLDDGTVIPAGVAAISPKILEGLRMKQKTVTVGVSEFVKRQSEHSTFTHFNGEWEDLIELTKEEMSKGNLTEGYREGVILVQMDKKDAKKFLTFDAYPMFEGMKLDAQWARVPGREHEPAKFQVRILEPKIPCNYVDIVLYQKEVLLEDKDNVTGADWDIVSINGRLAKNPPPIDPMTLVRNWLHLKGGTEMKGTTEPEMLTMLCDSILYKNGMKKHMSKKGS